MHMATQIAWKEAEAAAAAFEAYEGTALYLTTELFFHGANTLEKQEEKRGETIEHWSSAPSVKQYSELSFEVGSMLSPQ